VTASFWGKVNYICHCEGLLWNASSRTLDCLYLYFRSCWDCYIWWV